MQQGPKHWRGKGTEPQATETPAYLTPLVALLPQPLQGLRGDTFGVTPS